MKKKLCFVISSMNRGGAERVMSILINNAVKMGHDVNLVLLSGISVDYELPSDLKIVKISERLTQTKGIKKAIERLSVLKNVLVSLQPDLVVSFLTTCNMYVALALKNTNIPFVVSERNDPKTTCRGLVKSMLRNFCYRKADGVIFQTQSAKEYFSKRIQEGSVVIPNPVKNDLPSADIEHPKNVVVAAARLMPQKNYPMLLKAFQLFWNDHPDYELHIYGDGEQREGLLALAEELGISSRVVFQGNVLDLHERIKHAKMFVLSSDYEGISNSLLEALAMGLPCVSTDCPCGGSRMLIEDGVSSLLTPVGDEVAFYQAMKKIAEDDKLALTLSQNASRVRELYSENTVIKCYFDYFDRIINQK